MMLQLLYDCLGFTTELSDDQLAGGLSHDMEFHQDLTVNITEIEYRGPMPRIRDSFVAYNLGGKAYRERSIVFARTPERRVVLARFLQKAPAELENELEPSIPPFFLVPRAVVALETLLALRFSLYETERGWPDERNYGQDACIIIAACRGLKNGTEPENVHNCARDAIESLGYNAICILAAATWTFSSNGNDPTRELTSFMRAPTDANCWKNIYENYKALTCSQKDITHFKKSCDFL